jgi:hypothetical protein
MSLVAFPLSKSPPPPPVLLELLLKECVLEYANESGEEGDASGPREELPILPT